MLNTYDRAHWVEEKADEDARGAITFSTPATEIRKHYPFSGIVRKNCMAYGIKEGQQVLYVRTRHCVQFYPMEALLLGKSGERRFIFVSSQELQLIEPLEKV